MPSLIWPLATGTAITQVIIGEVLQSIMKIQLADDVAPQDTC